MAIALTGNSAVDVLLMKVASCERLAEECDRDRAKYLSEAQTSEGSAAGHRQLAADLRAAIAVLTGAMESGA